MQNRLREARQAAARLAERAKSLRPGASDDEIDVLDDDEKDEDLPPVEVADDDHAELAGLDDEHAEPIALDKDQSLWSLLHRIDPTPPVPLTEKHEVGLVALVRRLGEMADASLLEDRRARRVLDLVGDRLSISAGPDGITVRSLLRRRHTPWKRIQRLTIQGRYELARGDGVAMLMESIRSNIVPFPIPGLGWLLRRVTNGIANWLESHMDEDEINAMREEGGSVLLGIQRRGRDIELEGPLLLVALLSPGLSEALEQEARARGIPVESGEA